MGSRTTRSLSLPFVVAVALVTTLSVYACARPAPFVSNPREEWEEVAERGMLRIQPPTRTPRPLNSSNEGEDIERSEKNRNQAEEVLAGVIGFPFRAVAWIAHVIF